MSSQMIGRYQLENPLGRGGMATVYRAYDPKFQRYVAVKMLYDHSMLDDESSRAKFAQEARLIASLEHHAIVPVYDYGEHEGRPYLVMRLMTGGSLSDRLQDDGAMDLDEVGRIMTRICAALDKAHANHVVHRDIKPANILFDEEGVPFLADFGIARLVDGTQTTTLLGSPHYMAPEQAQGLPLSSQTDIYQMGAVLFRMLTGRTPFSGESTESILFQHVHMDVPMLQEVAPELPPRLDGVLGYAMAKRPEERYAHASELASAFVQTISGRESVAYTRPTAVRTPEPEPEYTYEEIEETYEEAYEDTYSYAETPYESAEDETVISNDFEPVYQDDSAEPLDHQQIASAEPAKQTPWWLIVGLVVGAVGLLACGIGLWQVNNWLNPPTDGDNPTVIQIPTRATIDVNAENGVVEEPEAEGTPELAPTVTLPSDSVASGEVVVARTAGELAQLGGGAGQIAYTADRNGNFDIFVTNDDGTERQLTTHGDDDFRPVWSPDGSRIAYHSLRDTWEIFIMNPDGSGAFNLTRNPADDSFPQWSPDGTQIAFHSNRNQKFDVFVVNVDGSNLRQLTSGDDDDFGPAWSPDGSQITFQRRVNGVRQIAVMNADGSDVRVVTNLDDGEAVYPQWSPDGSKFVFYSNQDSGWNLYTINTDGSGERQITNDANPDFYVSWSPNGEWLIYHSLLGNDNRDLFMTKLDGSETIRLTSTLGQERMPHIRP